MNRNLGVLLVGAGLCHSVMVNATVLNAAVSADQSYLIIDLISDAGAIPEGGVLQFFIDADNDSATGFNNGSDIVGADYMVENGTLYSSTSSSWGWVVVGDVYQYTASMPAYFSTDFFMDTLGLTTASTINVGAYAFDANWSFVESYHGAAMMTFNLSGEDSGDTGTPTVTGTEISAAVDSDQLVATLASSDVEIDDAYRGYFIDSDNDASTGYSSSDVTGADYMIIEYSSSYGELYQSLSTSEWSWQYVDAVTVSLNLPQSASVSATASSLGVLASTVKVGVLGFDSSWNIVSNYHDAKMISVALSTTEFTAVFNQAYIDYQDDGSEVDDIDSIVAQAADSYILVDAFGDDTSLGYDESITSQIAALQANGNEVGGYISAGTAEDWRADYEAGLKVHAVTEEWEDWEGEFFINDTDGALPYMKARIDSMNQWGLDWVEFDNMDWVDSAGEAGLSEDDLNVTREQATAYLNELCSYTQSLGMKCMAKNTVEGYETFDGVTYESYANDLNWWAGLNGDPSDETKAFLSAGKPVVIFHYGTNDADCQATYNDYVEDYGDAIVFACASGTAAEGYTRY